MRWCQLILNSPELRLARGVIAGRGLELDPGYSTLTVRLSTMNMEDDSKHLVIAEDGANPVKASDEIWWFNAD
ncbi:hypothetical protein GB937_001312 [Aspergillus fischeri]|nr:hypothetical protein GB937_001312 [Aspergillus fischeri]